MAFPAVQGTITATNGTTASATPAVSLPSGIQAGELLVVLFRTADGTTGVGWPGGWTELAESTADGSNDATAIGYRWADGTEGASISLSTTSARFAALSLRISGAINPATQAPQLSTVATGASTAPDPTTCTPTGGAKDYLWLWLGGWEGEQDSPPASQPTSYSNPSGANSGTAGLTATNCRVALATRQLNAASENPGSWTISASDDWTAWTMAVHPGEAPVTPSPVGASAGVAAPTVSVGSVAVTPSPVSSSTAVAAPTVAVGAISVSPDPIAAGTQVAAPTLTVGAVQVEPTPVAAATAVASPTVGVGGVSVTPSAVAAVTGIADPTVALTTTVQPDPVAVSAGTAAPGLTLGAVSVAPEAVGAQSGVPAPSLALGPISVAPEAVTSASGVPAPIVTVGEVSVTPSAVSTSALVVAPSVIVGAIQVAPTPLAALSSIPDPEITVGSVGVGPDPVAVAALVADPTVFAPGPAQEVFPEPVLVSATVGEVVAALSAASEWPGSRVDLLLRAASEFGQKWAATPVASRIVWPNEFANEVTAAETHWLRWNWFEGTPRRVERSTELGIHVESTLLLEIYTRRGYGDTLARRVAREAQEVLDQVSPNGRLRFRLGEYRTIGDEGAWWHANLIVPVHYEGASL